MIKPLTCEIICPSPHRNYEFAYYYNSHRSWLHLTRINLNSSCTCSFYIHSSVLYNLSIYPLFCIFLHQSQHVKLCQIQNLSPCRMLINIYLCKGAVKCAICPAGCCQLLLSLGHQVPAEFLPQILPPSDPLPKSSLLTWSWQPNIMLPALLCW